MVEMTCVPVVYVFAWNSAPTRAPAGSKRWPKMPCWSPSWPKLVQVTTKLPSAFTASAGAPWELVVYLLTRKSDPTGIAAAS